MTYDVVIAGGGPAGLSAALALGRARKKVLVADAGPRRNAAAEHIHNFITRDGTPPRAFRDIAWRELATYPQVERRDEPLLDLRGEKDNFVAHFPGGTVNCRRAIIATGMVDQLLPIPGFGECWGHSIFQCPYCHGWEVQDQRFGVLVPPDFLEYALFLRGWSQDITLLTQGAYDLSAEQKARFDHAKIQVRTEPVSALVHDDGRLLGVTLGAATLPLDVLFARTAQTQVPLIATLGLALAPEGWVQTDPMRRETSRPGIYAAGDLTTMAQGALFAASAGTMAAAMLNHELTLAMTEG